MNVRAGAFAPFDTRAPFVTHFSLADGGWVVGWRAVDPGKDVYYPVTDAQGCPQIFCASGAAQHAMREYASGQRQVHRVFLFGSWQRSPAAGA